MNDGTPFSVPTRPQMIMTQAALAQHPLAHRQIESGPYRCTVQSPPATQSRVTNGIETVAGLPPYRPVSVFNAKDFDAIPDNWRVAMANGADVYFFLAENGHGLWFDLQANNAGERYTAVVIGSQGINALTGLEIPKDQFPPRLEQFTNCPVHGTPFNRTGGRGNSHCSQCGYDWPDQNYLSNTNGETFWRDGFRTPEGANGSQNADSGKTRQWLFTATEEGRGVAQQLIGERRTEGMSLTFYQSRDLKPRPSYGTRGGYGGGLLGGGMKGSFDDVGLESMAAPTRSMSAHRGPEIAAGALINQQVGRDRLGPAAWDPTTARFVWILPIYAEAMAAIIASARGQSKGFMGNMPTGYQP